LKLGHGQRAGGDKKATGGKKGTLKTGRAGALELRTERRKKVKRGNRGGYKG